MKDTTGKNIGSGGNMYSASLDINIGAAIKTTNKVSKRADSLALKNSWIFKFLSGIVLFFFDKKVHKCEQRLVTLSLELRVMRSDVINSLDVEFNESLVVALDRLKIALSFSWERLNELNSLIGYERYRIFIDLIKETYTLADLLQTELEEQNASIAQRSTGYAASSVKELEAILDKIASLDE